MMGAGLLPSLVLAIRFLTIVPVPGPETRGVAALGAAARWFPLVGLAMGAGLAGLDRILAHALPPVLGALVVVSVWKLTTGGIHLAGLAAALDDLRGPEVEHGRAIARGPRTGVPGAVALILAFLLALAALAEVPGRARGGALLLAPMLGRLAPLLLGRLFRAAPPGGGVGGVFIAGLPRAAGPAWLAGVAALGGVVLGKGGLVLVGAGLGLAAVWAAGARQRLGGLTGEALGASVEVAELGALLGAASLTHLGWL